MTIQINFWTLVLQIVNFAILLVALKAVLYEPMVRAIGDRQARIKKELDEAESLNRQARELKAQYEAKLKEAHQEAAGIIAAAHQEAERKKTELLEEGRREAHFLVEKGRNELQREQQQAMSDLRGRVVGLSVEMAGRLFRDALSPEQHRALIETFVKKADQIHVG